MLQGDVAQAATLMEDGLSIYRGIGGKGGTARCLEVMAAIHLRETGVGDMAAAESAALFMGAAAALREKLGMA